MYSEKVMDHFEHPEKCGRSEKCQRLRGYSADMQRYLYAYVSGSDENGVIQDCKFKTFSSCGAGAATSSMATELVKGKTVAGGVAGDE